MTSTLPACLLPGLRDYAPCPALIDACGEEVLTYRTLEIRLRQVAALLHARGVRRGDVVTLISGNSLDMAVMLLGTMCHGAIAKPLNPALSAREITTLIEHSGSRHLFCATGASMRPGAEEMSAYRAAPPLQCTLEQVEVTADDGALLVYTSGTTGKPKGVLLRHANLGANVATAIEWLSLDARHRTLCMLPLFHTFGLVSDLLPMLFVGGAAVIAPVFDVTWLKSIEEALRHHAVASFSAVPLIFDLMLRLGVRLDPGLLKFCVSGAAPLHRPTSDGFFDRYRVPIVPAYGMTELTCFGTISPPAAIVPGSAGVPANMRLRIVGDGGNDLPPGEIGELVAAGDNVMRGGYFRDDRLCYLDTQGRWFLTGDLGYLDGRGYVHVTGRKKNMVIRGGEKVYLEDLDRALLRLAGVDDAATVGIGAGAVERIVCFVARGSGALGEKRVMDHLRGEVGATKLPDLIVFCDRIPRTATNKVKIAELQARARELS